MELCFTPDSHSLAEAPQKSRRTVDTWTEDAEACVVVQRAKRVRPNTLKSSVKLTKMDDVVANPMAALSCSGEKCGG
jgi:hypothetical protein